MQKVMSGFAVGAIAFLGACDAQDPMATEDIDASAQSRVGANAQNRTYEITITNLTGGQPFTPPLVATHDESVDVFDVGSAASLGVIEIAENGNLGPLAGTLNSTDGVSDVVIAVASAAGPLMPGTSVTFTIEGSSRARFLSFVSMLICTNDGFTGVDARKLPWRVGQTRSGELPAYDAGSEINTEDFADLVPPCPPLTGRPTDVPGSGVSDPALAENGVIHMHQGVVGFADLEPGLHGFSPPVATISVTRIN